MKKPIQKINEAKSWFSKKFNKIDKLLAKLTEKREKTQIFNIRNEAGDVTIDPTNNKKIISDYS